jgi:hypothetical protein
MHAELYEALLKKFPVLSKIEELFREAADRPRVVFPIGISGSGKSSAVGIAVKNSWTIINADETRRNHLRELAVNQMKIELNGVWKIPDANLASDVFAPELRKTLPNWILDDFKAALEARQNIVLDITNLTLERVRYLLKARTAGYHCEAVLFPSLDLGINASRVKGRGERGGLDIVDASLADADERRMAILQNLNANFWGFLESLSLAPTQLPAPSDDELFDIDFAAMKNHRGDFASLLSVEPPARQKLLKMLAHHDSFDRVYVIPAPTRAPSKTVPK